MTNTTRKVLLSMAGIVASLAATFSTSTAQAADQMYGFYGSETRLGTSPNQRTYFFQFEYMHDINDIFSASVEYTNLGHFNQGIEHHIDTDGVSLWAHKDLFDHKLRLAGGLGADIYYDTTGGTYRHATDDVHGLGTNESLSATWYGFSPVLLTLRSTWNQTGSVKTQTTMLGVGIELGKGFGWSQRASDMADSSPAHLGYPYTTNEVTLYGVRSVINMSGDAHATGFAVEYRHDLNSFMQVSGSFLREGKSGLADRQGLMSEVWLDKSFFDNHLSLGVGAGLYLANDSMKAGAKTFVAPVRSFTIAYNFNDHLSLRTSWDRPITNYGRDSDVARIGFSYRF